MIEWSNAEKRVQPKVLHWYQQIHRHPELGLQEYATSELIAQTLQQLPGMVVERLTETGVVATLRGGREGGTVAFRADMDALPIQEQTECAWQSQNDGVMHACGHDGHVAMLLGIASVLAEEREQMAGTVRFIFQPAEEIGAGAKELIAAGALQGVNRILGAHLDVLHPTGSFGIKSGPIMAASHIFQIEIHGKGGHAAFPDQAIDSVYIAAQVIQALHGIVSRHVNPFHRAVLTVSQMQASNAPNIIAETVRLGGTVRVLDSACEKILFEQMEKQVQGICQANGASCTIIHDCITPMLDNTERECRFVSDVLAETFGKEAIYQDNVVLGGENFSEYLQDLPGCFYKVGAMPTDAGGIVYPHHNAHFRFDPDALMYGVRAGVTLLKQATSWKN